MWFSQRRAMSSSPGQAQIKEAADTNRFENDYDELYSEMKVTTNIALRADARSISMSAQP
jgi:hypothetical protein